MKILRALSFTIFVFGLAGWVYIAGNAISHPETLHLPLTHFLSWPREDTFGAICFFFSFISLFTYRMLKEK